MQQFYIYTVLISEFHQQHQGGGKISNHGNTAKNKEGGKPEEKLDKLTFKAVTMPTNDVFEFEGHGIMFPF